MVKHNLSKSKYYQKFIFQRDQALEIIFNKSRLRQAQIMDKAFTHVLDRVNHRYPHMALENATSIDQLDQEIQRIFQNLAYQLFLEIVDLRKKTYMLSHVGEAQAISGALNVAPKFKADYQTLANLSSREFIKGPVIKIISLALNSIRRKIITKIEECLLTDEPVTTALYFTFKQFPRKRDLPKKSPLKKVKPREAAKPKFEASTEGDDSVNIAQGSFNGFNWDQVTWDQVVDDYKNDFIKIDRSPNAVYSLKDPLTEDPLDVKYDDGIYAWQVEQETTHDFVQQVRDGQIAAANDQGIDDFVVITVIDDHTCDACCGGFGCVDFDGLLVSEISAMTKDLYSTPPYHFSCRCTLAPAASSDKELLNDLSNYGDWTADKKDFDEWLNQ